MASYRAFCALAFLGKVFFFFRIFNKNDEMFTKGYNCLE